MLWRAMINTNARTKTAEKKKRKETKVCYIKAKMIKNKQKDRILNAVLGGNKCKTLKWQK